jgi:hypothetical protein
MPGQARIRVDMRRARVMTKRFFPASIPGHFGVVAGLL